MKLTIREDSTNYACTVVKLPPKQKVQGLDKLVSVTVFGNDVLTGKDTPEDTLYLFFPAECCISPEYLSANNEFRHSNLNEDQSKSGFFEDTGRVKAIKFKGVISTGYIAPVDSLEGLGLDYDKLKEGDEFTDLDGVEICRKYRPIRMQGTTSSGESRFNKKLKRFDRLVSNQFRFHLDTAQLAKNLHKFNPDDIIVITDKWHGTSAVFANLLVKKELTWYEKLAKALVLPSMKKYLNFNAYDNLYSSRSVLKNQYINKQATAGYYNEDIWGIVNKELEGKIEHGISLYGEIVGYLQSGKAIQHGYDYGCSPIDNSIGIPSLHNSGQHRFLVYRITYTKPDGSVIEFSWQQIKDYCNKYGIEYVIELYFGRADFIHTHPIQIASVTWGEKFLWDLQKIYLEKDCGYCKNKVPAEGIVVRIDGKEHYSAFKLKSKRFLERETKQLDKGEVNIEDAAVGDYEGTTS